MAIQVPRGTTGLIMTVFIRDTSTTDSIAGLTGLAHNTSGLTAYYNRNTASSSTEITLADMTLGTYTSGGFKEIDATNMPGYYQFCPPNAGHATGADFVSYHLKGASNMENVVIEVALTDAVNVSSGVIESNVVEWKGSAPANLADTDKVPTSIQHAAANVITASSIASGALTAAKFAAGAFDAVWSVTTRTLSAFGFSVTVGTNNDKTGYSISGTLNTLDDLDTTQDSQHATTQSAIIALNDLSAAEVNAEVDTALADYDPPTKAELDSGLAGLNDLDAAGVRTAIGLATANLDTQLGKADLTAALTEAYRSTGAEGSATQLLYEILAHLGEFVYSGTTKTTKQLDGSTTAKTYTLNDASNPTSVTEAT